MAITNYSLAMKSHDTEGVQYVNTLAIELTTDSLLGPDEFVDVAEACESWLATAYRACLAPQYTVDEFTVQGIEGLNGEGSSAVGLAGTLADLGGAPLPRECAAVITWRTAFVGRQGRGRVYIPSPRDASYVSDQSTWNTGGGFWPALAGFGDAVLAGWTGTIGSDATSELTACVWSRVSHQLRPITSYVRRPAVRWLRSRAT